MSIEIEKRFVENEVPLRPFPDEDQIVKDLEGLLSDPKNVIGEGRTAEVREMSGNPNYCLKIIDDERLDAFYGADRPIFNTEELELELLSTAKKNAKSVRIPNPLIAWKVHAENDRKIGIIVMERLDATSIKEIYEGAPLPESFDANTFFDQLYEGLSELHSVGLHHRDISEGNVLVDNKTGKPCLVDFGDAVKVPEGENPYTIRDDFGRTVRTYRNDMKVFAEMRKRCLISPKLTILNK